jgi:hypothetical protein
VPIMDQLLQHRSSEQRRTQKYLDHNGPEPGGETEGASLKTAEVCPARGNTEHVA